LVSFMALGTPAELRFTLTTRYRTNARSLAYDVFAVQRLYLAPTQPSLTPRSTRVMSV